MKFAVKRLYNLEALWYNTPSPDKTSKPYPSGGTLPMTGLGNKDHRMGIHI